MPIRDGGFPHGGGDAEAEQGDQGEVEDRPGGGAQHGPVGQGQWRGAARRGEAVAGQDEPPGEHASRAPRRPPAASTSAAEDGRPWRASTVTRCGMAVKVVRIMPVLYSPLMTSTARIATTAWPNWIPVRLSLAVSEPGRRRRTGTGRRHSPRR